MGAKAWQISKKLKCVNVITTNAKTSRSLFDSLYIRWRTTRRPPRLRFGSLTRRRSHQAPLMRTGCRTDRRDPDVAHAAAVSADELLRQQGVMKYPPPPVVEDEEEKPGDMFEGTMSNGKREGLGKYTWSNEAVYEGPYVDNKKHGKGKLSMPNKSIYEGWLKMSALCRYLHA